MFHAFDDSKPAMSITEQECSILLHGSPAPRAIRDHFRSLYATGTL